MKFLKGLGEKVAAIFGRVADHSQKVEGLGREIAVWERRRESLEAEKATAYACLLDAREAEMEGRLAPETLAAARSALADVEERLDAVSRKILTLMETCQAAIQEEIAVRHETAPQRVEALEQKRRDSLPAIARSLAQAVFLCDRFYGPQEAPFSFSKMAMPQAFDEEMQRLRAEAPEEDFLGQLYEAKYDLRRTPGSSAVYNYSVTRMKQLLKNSRAEVVTDEKA